MRLRCVLFHHIAASDGPFTRGLGVTVSQSAFESRIRFLSRHYQPISLDGLLASNGKLPARPVLVTFDDAYGSVARQATPTLRRWGVPAVFFVNAASVEGNHLPVDNLVCFVANTVGIGAVRSAVAEIGIPETVSLDAPHDVIARVVSRLNQAELEQFVTALLARCPSEPLREAHRANLLLSPSELRSLPGAGVEIGSHTYHHVWCRHLDHAAAQIEVIHNSQALEAITGHSVRAFSVPYGHRFDLTPTVAAAIQRAGHRATFLVESRPNRQPTDLAAVQRISLGDESDLGTAMALEVLPLLRGLRDRVRP
jgi:peptidoglycan/xylan/chitin deacetylase (PgdA/CDA1 family)